MAGGAVAAPRPETDVAQPFMLESSGIRGDLVRLGASVDEIASRHAYPRPLAALVGEMLVLTAMLSTMMKYKGVFTLQTKGSGPVHMVVTDATSEGHLRGYAGFDAARLAAVLARHEESGDAAPPTVSELLGRGYLAFTVDQGAHTDRYQGIVELTGPGLADCLQHYFRQSEQVRSGLVVAVARTGGAWRAAGLVLQRVPKRAGDAVGDEPDADPVDEDAWHRAMVLLASCTREELLDWALPIDDLLYRLFHEEGVRVFARRPLLARCRCSRARLDETLRAMAPGQIDELKVDGAIVMTCQFCGRDYRFDETALARLHAP